MRTAGEWLARRDRGFTTDEAAAFAAWVSADPLHAAAVAQLERTLSAFDGLREIAPPGALDRAHRPDPDAFAPPRKTRGWFVPLTAAAGIAAALALAFWRMESSSAPTTWHYTSAPAAYERAMLPDGSLIELNGDTVVDVEFTAERRSVRLTRGEAHFQVAKNPARPFVVRANNVAFRAVGTAFNVRLTPGNVEMLVTEGKVQVEPSLPATATPDTPFATRPDLPVLTAGHKIVVAAARPAVPTVAWVSPEEIERALAWQPRVAEFKQTPLSEVVAEFNRQNRQHIVIADAELKTLRLGGNFRVDQPDAFVRLLETSFGIAAERAGEVVTLRKAP